MVHGLAFSTGSAKIKARWSTSKKKAPRTTHGSVVQRKSKGARTTSQSTNLVGELIEEVRSVFEIETTIGRVLGWTKESLERFLANPASVEQIKQSLDRVLARKATPYGQPVDQDGYGSWRLYTDPTHLFCIRPTHQRSTNTRQPHDHGELAAKFLEVRKIQAESLKDSTIIRDAAR